MRNSETLAKDMGWEVYKYTQKYALREPLAFRYNL